MKSIIALVDCNNFFVSCERLFRPDLERKPVVVLSSNDGCVVSRSNEAKALGIPMGAPAFQYKQLFKERGVVQFSANFDLYGDISSRITRSLTAVVPLTEVYSVDESFLDLSHLKLTDYEAWAKNLKLKLLKLTGIPVAIGMSSSKTLAKIATERTKKDTPDNTVLDLLTPNQDQIDKYLGSTLIQDVWGVGRKLAPKLRAERVHTALDLKELDPRYAQQLMGIHGRQMVAELNGQNCYPIKVTHEQRQSIMHGRMFGEDTNNYLVVEAAIASLTARAAKQLRKEALVASSATVVLRTNRHKPNYKQLARTIDFDTPTADTGLITSELSQLLQKICSNNIWIHKADVMLHGLIPEDRLQLNLIDSRTDNKSKTLYKAFDRINERYGNNFIRLASEDLSANWQPKKRLISPKYTTSWNDLPLIR